MRVSHGLEVYGLVLVAALLVAGCESPGVQGSVERRLVGDTLLVFSEAPEFTDTIQMMEVLRIGTRDGPPEQSFTFIRSLGVGPGGDLFVYDQGDGIRHFSADGRFLGWTARRGQGPGEVRHVTAIDVSESGVVATQDIGNARITLFHTDNSITIIPGPFGRPVYSDEDALLFHRDGTLWVKLNPLFPPPGGITHPRPIYSRVEVSEKTFVDTIFTPSNAAEGCPTLSENPFMTGVWEDTRERWIPKTLWASGPDGTLVIGCPSTYEFLVNSPEGHTMKVRRRWRANREAEEALLAYKEWSDMGQLPSALPAYAQIILPGDGKIWVWPTRPSEPDPVSEETAERLGFTERWMPGTDGAFDVFAADGHWIGVVKPPPGFEYSGFPTAAAVVIRGDTVWAVAEDSLDVDYIIRCEVSWPESNRERTND